MKSVSIFRSVRLFTALTVFFFTLLEASALSATVGRCAVAFQSMTGSNQLNMLEFPLATELLVLTPEKLNDLGVQSTKASEERPLYSSIGLGVDSRGRRVATQIFTVAQDEVVNFSTKLFAYANERLPKQFGGKTEVSGPLDSEELNFQALQCGFRGLMFAGCSMVAGALAHSLENISPNIMVAVVGFVLGGVGLASKELLSSLYKTLRANRMVDGSAFRHLQMGRALRESNLLPRLNGPPYFRDNEGLKNDLRHVDEYRLLVQADDASGFVPNGLDVRKFFTKPTP